MKTYRNTLELIEHLKTKNVTIKNEEKTILCIEKYSYYSIVNTYNNVFKNNNAYIANVSFEEIFALYEFDKNIKAVFLTYALEIEILIKAKLAELLAKNYGLNDYLKTENFNNNPNNIENIEKLLEDLKQSIKNNHGKHPAIRHYIDNHGYVPPYILIKIISFGLLSRTYGLLKQKDRQYISKNYKLSDTLLKQILLNLTIVRNICAHSDRLYCFRSKFPIKFKQIDNTYTNNNENLTNLYMIIKCTEKILDKDKFIAFEVAFNNEVEKLKSSLVSIDIKSILKEIGYNNE